jgi:hypothetical protein
LPLVPWRCPPVPRLNFHGKEGVGGSSPPEGLKKFLLRDLRRLLDPGRINIFERWESQAARETFRSSGPDKEQRAAMLTVAVQEDIADARPVFGERTA